MEYSYNFINNSKCNATHYLICSMHLAKCTKDATLQQCKLVKEEHKLVID